MNSVSLSIGGIDVVQAFADAGHEFIIKEIGGRDPLPVDVNTVDMAGRAGVRLLGSSLPAREIQVAYGLFSDDDAGRLEAGRLLGRLMGTGLQRVEFSDDSGYYMAVVSNGEGERWPWFGHGVLTFFCPKPFLYGEERTVIPAGGMLMVEANYPVEPLILWTTSSSVGAAWIEVDGKRLTIDTGISSGQQIRIDCARKEVRVGGVLNVENIHGVFPRIRDGSTVTTSPGGSISFAYQERWI